jgi:hypothetical protein
MSDVSMGEGWWRASDAKWYPPETHPDYVEPVVPPPDIATGPPPQQAVAPDVTAAPTQVEDAASSRLPWSVIVVGGALVVIGTFLPWASLDGADLGRGPTEVAGLETDDGKIMLLLAAAVISFAVVHVVQRSTWAAVLTVLSVLGALGLTIFEIIDVSGAEATRGEIVVGVGLYGCLAGTLVAGAGVLWSQMLSGATA